MPLLQETEQIEQAARKDSGPLAFYARSTRRDFGAFGRRGAGHSSGRSDDGHRNDARIGAPTGISQTALSNSVPGVFGSATADTNDEKLFGV